MVLFLNEEIHISPRLLLKKHRLVSDSVKNLD